MKRTAVVCKSFGFEATHHLEYHEGLCQRWHGHSYKLKVCVRGPIRSVVAPEGGHGRRDSDVGMVIDLADLAAIVRELVIIPLDHQDLSEALPDIYTTTETLAHWIWDQIEPRLELESADLSLASLTLKTRIGSVTIGPDDRRWIE